MEQCFKQKSSFRTIRIILFSLSMLFAYATNGYAQNMVRGVVTDVTGDPLPGVSVVVKGTTTGTTTDIDGRYSINVPSTGTLIFSYIGMAKHEVKTQGQTTINVSLSEDVSSLNEVVVVGYGTQKKVHLTGSVASASSKEILKTTASNISQALVGKLPGLVSQQSTGQPGADDVSFLVRGYSSYNGASTPLVLVDGVEREMARIDASDIESVTILKDASSCAVYGMKGANGVILITTKQGTEGKPVITYRGSVTFNHATNLPKMMNGTQYMQYYNLARQLDNIANGLEPGEGFFTDEEIAATYNGDPTDGYENTDWTSPIYKTTMMHQHNLSVSGGTDKTKYFISGGFLRHNGIIKDHKNQRGNFRSNITTEINRNLNVQLNIAGNIQDYYRPGGYTYENQKGYNLFHLMLYSLPYVPQEYNGYPTSGYRQSGSAANAVYGSANSGFEKARNVRLETSAKIEYSFPFLKGLKASMFASWDYYDGDGKTFTYAYDLMAFTPADKNNANKGNGYSLVKSANLSPEGNMYVGNNKRQKVMLRPSISYNNKIGLHDIGALFLYEQKKENSSSFSGSRKDFDIFDLPELNFGDAATATNGSTQWERTTVSMLARVIYNYKGKYLFNGSFRRDGSSAFSYTGNEWQNFFSLGGGWLMTEEEFMKDIKWLDMLKIKASYGTLGNQNLDRAYPAEPLLSNAYSAVFGKPSIIYPGYQLSYLPNPNLRWEKVEAWEAGFETNVLRNRLHFEGVYYKKRTKDLLAEVPGISGTVPGIGNLGEIENMGVEMAASWRDQIGDWGYSVSANLTTIKNKVKSLVQDGYSIIAGDKQQSYTMAGYPIGFFYGYKVAGVYQSQADIDASPENTLATVTPGDLKFADVNRDGKITPEDRTMIGNPTPDFTYGLSLGVNYKNWSLGIDMMGQHGNEIFRTWDNYNFAQFNYLSQRMDRWHGEGTSNSQPLLNSKHSINNLNSEYYIEDGSFFRIRNVQLAYSFDKALLAKIRLQALKVYVNIQNLKTWKHNTGYTPELGGSATTFGVDDGSYPVPAVYTFGINLTF